MVDMKDKSKVALLQEILKQPKAVQNISNVSNMAKMIKISDFSDSEQTGWFGPFATRAKRLTIPVRKSMIPFRKVSALRFLRSRTFPIPAISNCTAPGDATHATIRDTGDGSAFMICSSIRRK
jgi:hypothetical protein